jgi:hypothetical protein
MDAWLLKIVGENWMSIYLFLTLLKGIAIITPSATDDRIISLFSSVYNSLRSGEAPKTLEDK